MMRARRLIGLRIARDITERKQGARRFSCPIVAS
jgi:hypothetical protein